jgi:hypothetical protein
VRKSILYTSLILIAGLILVFSSCGGGATQKAVSTAPPTSITSTPTPQATTPAASVPTIAKPAGLETETYNNDDYKFSIEIPKGWTLHQTTQGQYFIFTWYSAEQVPALAVTVRNFMQPILIETYVKQFETEIYGAGYKETSNVPTTYGDTSVKYAMSITKTDGSATDVIGDTIYHQHGNNFYVVSDVVEKSDPGSMLLSLQYCASTFAVHLKMG